MSEDLGVAFVLGLQFGILLAEANSEEVCREHPCGYDTETGICWREGCSVGN